MARTPSVAGGRGARRRGRYGPRCGRPAGRSLALQAGHRGAASRRGPQPRGGAPLRDPSGLPAEQRRRLFVLCPQRLRVAAVARGSAVRRLVPRAGREPQGFGHDGEDPRGGDGREVATGTRAKSLLGPARLDDGRARPGHSRQACRGAGGPADRGPRAREPAAGRAVWIHHRVA